MVTVINSAVKLRNNRIKYTIKYGLEHWFKKKKNQRGRMLKIRIADFSKAMYTQLLFWITHEGLPLF